MDLTTGQMILMAVMFAVVMLMCWDKEREWKKEEEERKRKKSEAAEAAGAATDAILTGILAILFGPL
jgi:uncharacterized membrane protein YfcA